MGNNLLNTIKAITLGALDTLYYTVSLLKQKHLTGGVSMYTVTHYDINGFDLRSSNLKNNFQGGSTLRVAKSSIKSTNAYKFAEQEELEYPSIDMPDWIGRLYHLKDNVINPNQNFITEEGFGNFEFLLRKRNTNYKTIGQKYSSISTASIVSKDYESDPLLNAKEQNSMRMLVNTEYGSEYSFDGARSLILHSELKKYSEPFRNSLKTLTQYIDDKLGILEKNSSTYFNLKPENTLANTFDISTTHLDRTYSKELGYKQPTIVGNLMRGNYSYLRNYSFNEYAQGGNASYGDEIDISNPYIHAGRIKMTPDGIFDYYSGRREDIIGIGFYSYNRGYVFGEEGDKIEKYYVGDWMHPENDIKIQRDNEGNLLSMYYSEHDNGKPAGIIKHSELESFTRVEEGVNNVSALIRKTNELFENCKISSMVNRFHSYDLHKDDELVSSRSDKYGISRGRNLLKANDEVDDESGYENPYCRVWTKHHQYSKLSRRIRPFYGEKEPMKLSAIQDWYGETMRPNGGSERLGNFSVLKDNGFVKVSSEHNGGVSTEEGDIKKYMFSIENLAWRDIDLDGAKISKEQQGPNKGRIMWFPPYNLKFTENVNVDWNATKFIGRGEQIYTYVNTDRSGTLSFTMLIDHPSLINKWRGTSLEVEEIDKREDDLLRFFAGCGTLDGRLDDGANKTVDVQGGKTPNNKKLGNRSKDVALIVFFPNNFSGHYDNVSEGLEKLRDYECSNGVTCDYTDDDMSEQILHEGNDINNSIAGLNAGGYDISIKELIELSVFNGQDDGFEFYSIFDPQYGISNLNNLITEDEIFGDKFEDIHIDSIDVYGCASSHGSRENNIKLEERRAEFLKNAIIMNCKSISEESFNRPFQKAEIPANDLDPSHPDVNKIDAKIGRCAYAIFHVSWNAATTTTSEQYEEETINVNEDVIEGYGLENAVEEQLNEYISTSTEVVDDYRSDNEYLYFSEIDYDDVAYQRIINKVRYFNPAFHSVTPEGFNARLTFLHQCTRQGPTIDLSSGRVNTGSSDMLKYAGNLAFGRPPYCILRIGDFFHTKICITSISIDYDSGSGIQWDLNPEGVGVQPMYANVNMNFNFIGGQDIAGPIERLQNAVTSNYYANASIYDHKADVKGQSMYDVTVNVPKKDVGKGGDVKSEDVNGVYENGINDRVEKGLSDFYKNSIKGYKK